MARPGPALAPFTGTAKATDALDKKQLQAWIALLEKDDHIPGSSAKPEGKV